MNRKINKLWRYGFGLWCLQFSLLAWSQNRNAQEFNTQASPHLPPAEARLFIDGRDYFSYQEPIPEKETALGKISIRFFFDYDCRVCSSAQDILRLFSELRANKVVLLEYPVATAESTFSALVFYTLKGLGAGDLSDKLLFETSEKGRFEELATMEKIRRWVETQGIEKGQFAREQHSPLVQNELKQAILLTEEYGVFTYPYVVLDGRYVLTASTLYNDDYAVAVLDFLVNKIEKQRNHP